MSDQGDGEIDRTECTIMECSGTAEYGYWVPDLGGFSRARQPEHDLLDDGDLSPYVCERCRDRMAAQSRWDADRFARPKEKLIADGGEVESPPVKTDVTPRDALAIAQRALAKANDLEGELAAVDDLAARVAQLELRLSALDEDREYKALSTDERIGLVREHAFEKASETTGKAALDYNAIKWEVFDGEPSADYCYTLMERAAETDGFDVATPPSGNRSLVCDAAAAKRGAVFSSANKDDHTEGRSA